MAGLRVVAITTWTLLVTLSLKHLTGALPSLDPPTWLYGVLGWVSVASMLLLLGRRDLGRLAAVFVLFTAIGVATGAFLVPPGDPLEHLRRIYSFCDAPASEVPTVNRGLWQYSMSGILLCSDVLTATPESTLWTIDWLSGLNQGLLAAALFLAARASGLPPAWCGFALLTAFLFLGTKSLGYFRFFALGPTASSMTVYWLWIAAFFFRSDRRALLHGTLVAASTLPVLWVNHQQEATFVALAAGLWIALLLHARIWQALTGSGRDSPRRRLIPAIYLLAIIGVLFAAPAFESVRRLLAHFFLESHWAANQHLLFDGPLAIIRPTATRVWETLGLVGFLPLPMAVVLAWPGPTRLPPAARSRMLALSLLPFIVLFTPLLCFVWMSNVSEGLYWRIGFASLFWLPLTAAASRLEAFVPRGWALLLCALMLVGLSTIRSAPVYGKLDFLAIEARPWWPAWSEIVGLAFTDRSRLFHSDHVTTMVVQDVFDVRALNEKERAGHRALNIPSGYADPRNMNRLNADQSHHCVINLIGFRASWFPEETRFWNPSVADTAGAYRLESGPGDPSGLAALGRLENCRVFSPPRPRPRRR